MFLSLNSLNVDGFSFAAPEHWLTPDKKLCFHFSSDAFEMSWIIRVEMNSSWTIAKKNESVKKPVANELNEVPQKMLKYYLEIFNNR